MDMKSCQINVRYDDDNFRATVKKARDNIYQGGYALGSEHGVEQLLKEHSLVPTLVSYSIIAAMAEPMISFLYY
jgi:hypothetical protein